MKLKKSRISKKRKIIIFAVITVLVILVGAAASAYFILSSTEIKKDVNSSSNNGTSGEQQENERYIKTNGSDKPSDPTPIEGSTKKNVQITITAANQNESILQIRAQIDAVVSDGTCTLTLSKSNKTVTKTVSVQPLASVSTCSGFDVPISELSTGVWTANVTYNSSAFTGATEKSGIIIE